MGCHGAMVLVAGSLIACGRVSFEAHGDGTDAGGADLDASLDDADTRTFCARLDPAPTFCHDFEQGSIVPADPGPNASAGQVLVNGGALALSPLAYEGSGALEASYDAIEPTMYSEASVSWTLNTVANSVTVDYYIFIPQRPTMGHTEVMSVSLEVPGTGWYYYDLDLVDNGIDWFLQEFSPDLGPFMSDSVQLGITVSAGTWHHVVMAIDFAASTHVFSIDGVVLHSGANNYSSTPGLVTINTGIAYQINSSDPNHILVDNVAVYVD